MAQELFDRGGVLSGTFLLFTLWGAAVGTAFLPLRLHSRPLLVLPGPAIGLLLTLPAAVMVYPANAPLLGILASYWGLLLLTALVMGPATLLISQMRSTTVARAVLCIALCVVSNTFLDAIRPLPAWGVLLTLPLAPVVFLGAAVGVVLLLGSVMRHTAWYGAVASGVLFTLAWAAWIGLEWNRRR